MSLVGNASRTQPWLESLGDWTWPGTRTAGDFVPPSWVPASPPRFEPALAAVGSAQWLPGRRRGARRRLLVGAALSALAAVVAVAALGGPLALERTLGVRSSDVPPAVAVAAPPASALPLPAIRPVSRDSAGSAIDLARYRSTALGGRGSFYVYLPPGYPGAAPRYPVIYLLHGRDGHAEGFLEIGIQGILDRLIARKAIPPMIAVMIQDRSTLSNWRDVGGRHSASYVLEVQEMTDRMLPTLATRAGRAIAGASMGGFGAMHIALANPYRFSVVESWLGFFNNLDGELRAARPVIATLGLHAFLYGAELDPVADPSEDPAFAAKLRAAGAKAESAIYAGGHSLQKVRVHLAHMLVFAARGLAAAEAHASS